MGDWERERELGRGGKHNDFSSFLTFATSLGAPTIINAKFCKKKKEFGGEMQNEEIQMQEVGKKSVFFCFNFLNKRKGGEGWKRGEALIFVFR